MLAIALSHSLLLNVCTDPYGFAALCWVLLQVDKHREHLINYIIFLRITPFLPNWFINITSPVINVPLGVFFLGTFLGKALERVINVAVSQLSRVFVDNDCR